MEMPSDGARPVALPDVAGPGLCVLFCGINPGLMSAATGHHFARPGNRFWKVLHASGFTDRLLNPAEQGRLPALGLGITNLVARPSAASSELTRDDLRRGALDLEAKVGRWAPGWVAVLGAQAYRIAFGRPRAAIGPQTDRIGGAGLWLLPNPSGLQARYQLDEMTVLFAALRAASGHTPRSSPPHGPWSQRS
jgi:TDG/mug DNA glycosylase family protein